MPRSSAKSAVGESAQVAQHRRLGAVLGEHGVAQDGPAPQQRLGQRVAPPSLPAAPSDRRRPRAPPPRGRRSWSPRTRCRRGRRRRGAAARPAPRASATIVGARPGAPHDDACRRTHGGRSAKPPASSASARLGRPAVHPARDAAQALGPVVHGVHGGDHGQQHLRRADVRRRLLAPDVLLAGLQRQPVGGAALGVDREAHQPAGQVPLEPGLDRHERRVRAAVPERHAEALRRADDDVGAPLPRRLEQGQGQEVGGDRHQRAARVRLLGDAGEVADRRPSTRGTAAPRRRSRPSGRPASRSATSSSIPRGTRRVSRRRGSGAGSPHRRRHAVDSTSPGAA